MPEGSDLRVSESDQPYDERVQHVLVVDDAVLTLEDDVVEEVDKVTLERRETNS